MAEEPAAKIAKTSDESYYKGIDGVKYDRKLLETIEKFAADGQVSYVEAKTIWEEAKDSSKITECERDTIKYGLQTYKWTEKAAKAMNIYLEGGVHKSYYKVIDKGGTTA